MSTREEPRSWATLVLRGKQRASYSKALTYKVAGAAFNLTGYTATMTVDVNGKTALTLTSGNGITLGGAAGTITIAITRTQMAALPKGRHDIYCEITSPSGSEDRPIFDGTFVVE